MKIVKHSGELAQFNENKLRQSMLRSGADAVLVDNIASEVRSKLYPGISTRQIYKIAFRMLKNQSAATAARYNLREAISMLGPAGFYFEKYIARIFADHGYNTRTNLILQGRCVSHEIDVALEIGGAVTIVECKFHSRRESTSDVKVPMYILSRFNDLKDNHHEIFSGSDKISSCTIVNNNRFTADAIAFATCNQLDLLSWDYPPGRNLRTLNDGRFLYPVTAMTTITIAEKEWLLQRDILLARDLSANNNILQEMALSPARMKNILRETSELTNGTT